EGGILALLALAFPKRGASGLRPRAPLLLLGLFGAALLYGDGIITPPVTVLSAVEGLRVATHALDRFVVPVTVVILVGLFLFQRRGTAGIGSVFGPITLVWFITIAALGAPFIVRRPEILAALFPSHAVVFFAENGARGFLVLGSIILAVTGGEALYADMGHFGKRPIRAAWFAVVFPALLINYFGQGALLLERGSSVQNPFYELAPSWALYPVVAIATAAAVVASQALISGAFSITHQAVQLGYFPRVTVIHTSEEAEGQIFIPEVNRALMVLCVALTMGFQSADALASAYGIAVTGTMSITSLLFYALARRIWGFSVLAAGALVGVFLAFDLAFLGANLVKLGHGGWVPLAVAAVMFAVMTTWKRGRAELHARLADSVLPIEEFLADVEKRAPVRVPGTAVFMASSASGTPPVLLHHFKHNKVLHEHVLLVTIVTKDDPEVPGSERLAVTDLGNGFFRVEAAYGFMQTPNVLEITGRSRALGVPINERDTSYFLGRETLLTTGRSKMARWRKALFAFLSRNARPATAYFRLPPNRVVEFGTQIEL
ncbi:MAG TPA: KUP/HAK/KT family potassium transporter, partial [Polyangiaceae bacterium]|nr:KUP/HAK/KT family potassium transporter [Polyangiaceae bacterium]